VKKRRRKLLGSTEGDREPGKGGGNQIVRGKNENLVPKETRIKSETVEAGSGKGGKIGEDKVVGSSQLKELNRRNFLIVAFGSRKDHKLGAARIPLRVTRQVEPFDILKGAGEERWMLRGRFRIKGMTKNRRRSSAFHASVSEKRGSPGKSLTKLARGRGILGRVLMGVRKPGKATGMVSKEGKNPRKRTRSRKQKV